MVKGKSNNDLISHIWAGLPVLVHFWQPMNLIKPGSAELNRSFYQNDNLATRLPRSLLKSRERIESIRKRDRMLGILKLDSVADELKRLDGHTSAYLGLRFARERLLPGFGKMLR